MYTLQNLLENKNFHIRTLQNLLENKNIPLIESLSFKTISFSGMYEMACLFVNDYCYVPTL